ncbi:MAG: flagellar basal-body rod protein FlgG [Alphaproteobacteria bacterium]|nr:flagellar basal-body rod protein FlgG [Alphaproteobacteria bacterium]MBU2085455.1 flagellar basal-body rod protein FlgG [Alphaproteobacteria bacterium]MBU2143477.1 flagellar basal-body rod protein FlgG [Alphaproteobacteria bacterium]MBU2196124.1 flagellar basal-body rod protein FlgG [Alphaproteobacteria bacterium]
MKSLQIAATGMAAQQMRVDVISNNIANMSTSAYRPRVAEFSDLMYQQYLTPGTITSQVGTVVPAGIQIGTGVRPSTVSMQITQGALKETGGELDLAIDGSGFLEVTLPSGDSAYTRDGKLNRSAEGELVTMDGYPLADGITIPNDANRISISRDGEVVAYFDNAAVGQAIGAISLTRFVNEKGLEAVGDNLFRETEASGPPTQVVAGTEGAGYIRQGFIEASGVDVVKEISELIEAQRGYELNSKVITASDEMLAATTRLR